MKRKLLFLVCLAIVAQACQSSEPSPTLIKSQEGRFEINFPGEVKKSREVFSGPYGTNTKYTFECRPDRGPNTLYQLSYLDYPSEVVQDVSDNAIYKLFDANQKSLYSDPTLSLTYQANKVLLGYTGREFSWQGGPETPLLRLQMYLVRQRLYILMVETRPGQSFNKGITEFLDSFTLIDTPPKEKKPKKIPQNEPSFSVDFPNSQTRVDFQEAPSPHGTVRIRIEFLDQGLEKDENLAYFTGESTFEKDPAEDPNFDLMTFLEGGMKKAIEARKSELILSKEIEYQGIRGIEYLEYFPQQDANFTTRNFKKGRTLISLTVISPPDDSWNRSMESFFESLDFSN